MRCLLFVASVACMLFGAFPAWSAPDAGASGRSAPAARPAPSAIPAPPVLPAIPAPPVLWEPPLSEPPVVPAPPAPPPPVSPPPVSPPSESRERIDEVRPAAPRGVVVIDVIGGSVRVVGWARSEVGVKAAAGSNRHLVFAVNGDRTSVHSTHGELEIRVPAASSVEVRGSSADVSVRDLAGPLRVETLSGGITVAGAAPASIAVRSASGDVAIDAASAQTNVRSMSGEVRVRGARGVATLESVSGECSLSGGSFTHVEMRTTSGDMTFEGHVAARGSFDLRSHAGDVQLSMPATTNANFELRSYSGDIESRLGGARTGKGALDFRAGTGGPIVRVQTFSGDISIQTRK